MTTNLKCYEEKFPNIPDKYLKDFIRGVVDGDGTIGHTKKYGLDSSKLYPRLRILGNESFLRELNEATKKFCNHKTKAINKKGEENIYCVSYNYSTAKKILEWLYNDCKICLKRKFDRYIEVCT